MKLLVGLGNPGIKYQHTRHNIGFNAIKMIADKYKVSKFQNKFDGQMAKVKFSSVPILLFMPMTYMNNSGIPISKIVRFYKISLDDIYVIFDDIDLMIGRIKIKKGGGNIGHNGLKSIDDNIGKVYNKIRIGIGSTQIKKAVSDYVLSAFSNAELEKVQVALNFVAENHLMLLQNEFDKFMNSYCVAINNKISQV